MRYEHDRANILMELPHQREQKILLEAISKLACYVVLKNQTTDTGFTNYVVLIKSCYPHSLSQSILLHQPSNFFSISYRFRIHCSQCNIAASIIWIQLTELIVVLQFQRPLTLCDAEHAPA